MGFRLLWAWLVVWLLDRGHSPTGSAPSPMIEPGNDWNPKRTITMSHDPPWSRRDDESRSWKQSSLRDLFRLDEARRALCVYLAAMALVIFGGVYALWRIELLSSYLADNRAYVLERDARWEKHIVGQAEAVREILRRLPDR
jgi:hypothetical protein